MTPLESFLAWARYLYWADLHRQRYFEFFEGPLDAPTENEHTALFVALSGQWFAGLWVVVEGWQTLGVKDHFIDGLLAHRRDYATLLRRFRNGIYHFQPRLLVS